MDAPPARTLFCREIHVRIERGRAVGELVDDFHHFRATIEHDGERIHRAVGEALRIPWQTCGSAVDPLRRLEGQRLASTARERARQSAARLQCTHLYDAACIAAARAGRRASSVVYRMLVPDRVDGRCRATLDRDGRNALAWELEGHTVRAPEPFAGQTLIGGHFADWVAEHLDVEMAEAALALSRASVISMGRTLDLDDCARAVDVPGTRLGVCHTYSEQFGDVSFRVVGSARDLADADDARRASLRPDPGEIRRFHRRPH